MISSESINYSKYSIINEQNANYSTDLEINDLNKKIKEKENTDTDINSLIIPSDNENDLDKNKLLTNSEREKESINGLLYGNNIEDINPFFLGKCFAIFYNSNGDPRITIGPHCKKK